MSDQLLSIVDAAAAMGRSRRTADRLLKKGVLEPRNRKGSRRRYVTRRSVEAYVEARTDSQACSRAEVIELRAAVTLLQNRIERLEREKYRPRGTGRRSPRRRSFAMAERELRRYCEEEGLEVATDAVLAALPCPAELDPYSYLDSADTDVFETEPIEEAPRLIPDSPKVFQERRAVLRKRFPHFYAEE